MLLNSSTNTYQAKLRGLKRGQAAQRFGSTLGHLLRSVGLNLLLPWWIRTKLIELSSDRSVICPR